MLVSVYMCLRMCMRNGHVCMTACMSFLDATHSPLCVHMYGDTHWHKRAPLFFSLMEQLSQTMEATPILAGEKSLDVAK